jgi:predicted metal-dependent phosphoesterase TrpH
MEKTVDLHTHSTRSDGTLSPSELMRRAREKGLAAVALTDHDTVSGVEEAAAASAETGVELISGTELSAAFDGIEIHILGLFVDCHDEDFLAELAATAQTRAARNAEMLARLNALGADVSDDDVLGGRDAGTSLVTRAHFARALVKKGCCASVREAFDRYLSPGRPVYVRRALPPPGDVIARIRGAGGLSFLAHPVLCRMSRGSVSAMVKRLQGDGLDGIEALYSLNTPSDDVFFGEMAEKYRLLVTGGSDFHGSNKENIDIGIGCGNLRVPAGVLEKIRRFRVIP